MKKFWMISLLLWSVSGCQRSGGPPQVTTLPVTGTVTLDGQPLADADVIFISSETSAMFAGRTGSNGGYRLQALAGREGALKGEFKVTISRLVTPDGLPVAPDVPPANVAAAEQLPPKYSQLDLTTLTAVLSPEGGAFDFPLAGK